MAQLSQSGDRFKELIDSGTLFTNPELDPFRGRSDPDFESMHVKFSEGVVLSPADFRSAITPGNVLSSALLSAVERYGCVSGEIDLSLSGMMPEHPQLIPENQEYNPHQHPAAHAFVIYQPPGVSRSRGTLATSACALYDEVIKTANTDFWRASLEVVCSEPLKAMLFEDVDPSHAKAHLQKTIKLLEYVSFELLSLRDNPILHRRFIEEVLKGIPANARVIYPWPPSNMGRFFAFDTKTLFHCPAPTFDTKEVRIGELEVFVIS
ncbi:MAG: hypothetical protein KDD53_07010 [Bdellovibrionales bacterium]|nr:hypothetical protein [Bdellovibrionales bacterium]